MPPFSGKKKKEQLKAKRQRKREKEDQEREEEQEERRAREFLLSHGLPITEENLQQYYEEKRNEEEEQQQQHAAGKGNNANKYSSKAKQKKKKQKQKASGSDNEDGDGDGPPSGSDGSDDDDDDNEDRALGKDEYKYGQDRQGIRSVFKKDTDAEVAERRRLNYAPIQFREVMAQSGITFGSWFLMPWDATAKPQRSSHDDVARLNENGTPPPPPAAATEVALSAEKEIRVSRGFPASFEIPSRGWEINPASGSVVALSNTCKATKAEEAVTAAAPPSSSSSSSSSEEHDNDDDDNDDDDDGGGDRVKAVAAGKKGYQTKASPHDDMGALDEARFRAYLHALDHYAFPSPLQKHWIVSSYERNLDVWRQLWRTVEASDVTLVIADARYPIVHLPLGLLYYLTREARRPCVVVLNKIDLVPRFVLLSWIRFLMRFLTDVGLRPLCRPSDRDGGASSDSSDTCTVLVGEDGSVYDRDDRARNAALPAPIVLVTFTAEPPEDSGAGDLTAALTGQPKRRAKRKKQRGKFYEDLRAGRSVGAIAAAAAASSASAAVESHADPEAEETAGFGPQENFKGRAKAQNAMQREEGHRAIQLIAAAVTGLLGVCASLAPTERVSSAREATRLYLAEQRAKAEAGGNGGAVAEAEAAASSPTMAAASPTVKVQRHHHNNNKNNRQRKRLGRRSPYHSEADKDSDDSDSNESGDSGSDTDSEVDDRREKDDARFLHMGIIGFPNVGKSSLLNCIRGTKVVSVSATPGHTKHLQTIPLPEEGITLLDSPGLAFPLLGVPVALQAILGTHQIAQTRDPQSGVAYLARHLPLERLYHLSPPEGSAVDTDGWSPYELCEAYAKKRGYYVRRGKGALDVHRAAIALLREAYEGQLPLYFAPPELNLLESKGYGAEIRPLLYLPVFKETDVPPRPNS